MLFTCADRLVQKWIATFNSPPNKTTRQELNFWSFFGILGESNHFLVSVWCILKRSFTSMLVNVVYIYLYFGEQFVKYCSWQQWISHHKLYMEYYYERLHINLQWWKKLVFPPSTNSFLLKHLSCLTEWLNYIVLANIVQAAIKTLLYSLLETRSMIFPGGHERERATAKFRGTCKRGNKQRSYLHRNDMNITKVTA